MVFDKNHQFVTLQKLQFSKLKERFKGFTDEDPNIHVFPFFLPQQHVFDNAQPAFQSIEALRILFFSMNLRVCLKKPLFRQKKKPKRG